MKAAPQGAAVTATNVGSGMNGSFEAWFVNRNEAEPIQFEGTFTADWVRTHVTDAVASGYRSERCDGFARVIYEHHADGRPWVYQEFYPVEAANE